MRLMHGDCLEQLKTLADNSVDSLVTDPPAGIAFMGKEWDKDKGGRKEWVSWMTGVMSEALRVMKPGAHGLVWALPRTSHWTATALEDAGFEVRDVITHLFGSGFPKSLDVSKAIDKAAGAEREVVGENPNHRGESQTRNMYTKALGQDGSVTAPATDDVKKWQGWGTALKPASEHWILVRKPCSEKTVAANVIKWGTGALNIDASRILSADKRPDRCESCEKTQDVLSVSSAEKRTGPVAAGNSMSIAGTSAGALLSAEGLTTPFGGSTKRDTSDSNIGTIQNQNTCTSLNIERFGASLFPPGFVIHHLNENKQDNRRENLQLMRRSDHTSQHHLGKSKRKISK